LDLAVAVSKTRRATFERWLSDGTAWKKFVSLVYAQDGDASSLEKLSEVHSAPIQKPFAATKSGVVKKMDAEAIGRACVMLGGGRQKADDTIDFAVGFSGIKKIGEKIAKGEPLFVIHARHEHNLAAVMPLLEGAVEISKS
jgi:pyrimidine-nucleoside phosphorylase